MSAYHVVEVLIVAGVVGYAAWNFTSRFMPKLRRRTDPADSGCADCSGGCCSTPQNKSSEQPIRFHR